MSIQTLPVLLAGILAAALLWAVPSSAQTPPEFSYSFYMSTADASVAGPIYNLGLTFGEGVLDGIFPQQSIVILDWGTPYCDGSTCGAYMVGDDGSFNSTAAVTAASEAFGEGYYFGAAGDTTATVVVAMGINNYGTWFSNIANARQEGTAWGDAVNAGNTWLSQEGYITQASIAAAIDAELDWNDYSVTKAWSNAYDAASDNTFYYDFGDAAGCPPTGSCDNGWSQAKIEYVAWGATLAVPLPEIYNLQMAEEWGSIVAYAYNSLGTQMYMAGVSIRRVKIQAIHVRDRTILPTNPGITYMVN